MARWPWSVLCFCFGSHFLRAFATSGQFDSRDNTTSNLDLILPQTTRAAITNSSLFGNVSTKGPPQATTENSKASTSSGRHLTQVDKIFQKKYWLVGCRSGLHGTAADQLESLVTQIRLNLKVVIREARKGVDSQFGFEAFFKTNDNVPKVLEIFNKIANGDQVEVSNHYGRSYWLKSRKRPPIIGCAFSPNQRFNDDAYHICRSTTRVAYNPIGSAWVYLCPVFWNMHKTPLDEYCPQVYENGTTGPDDITLHENQQAVFVHEMVHMYLRPYPADFNEHYRVTDAIALSAGEAVENASNYGYFYSAVVAFCLNWPHDTASAGGNDSLKDEDGGL